MRRNELSEQETTDFIAQIKVCGVDALWYKTYDFRPDVDFSARKQLFMDVLYRILDTGLATLGRGDEILKSGIEQQVAEFERAWPAEEDWDDDFFWMSKSGVGWTPSGLVWVCEDGSEFWT